MPARIPGSVELGMLGDHSDAVLVHGCDEQSLDCGLTIVTDGICVSENILDRGGLIQGSRRFGFERENERISYQVHCSLGIKNLEHRPSMAACKLR